MLRTSSLHFFSVQLLLALVSDSSQRTFAALSALPDMGGLLARPSTTYFYDYQEDAWRWRWGGRTWRWSAGRCDAHWCCTEAYKGWWQETEEESLVKDCNCLWQGVAPPSLAGRNGRRNVGVPPTVGGVAETAGQGSAPELQAPCSSPGWSPGRRLLCSRANSSLFQTASG